jgi:hypothetical protein
LLELLTRDVPQACLALLDATDLSLSNSQAVPRLSSLALGSSRLALNSRRSVFLEGLRLLAITRARGERQLAGSEPLGYRRHYPKTRNFFVLLALNHLFEENGMCEFCVQEAAPAPGRVRRFTSIIAGGPAPLIATWLFATFKTGTSISWYIALCAVISFIATLFMTEYSRREIDEEYEHVGGATKA